MALKTPDTGLKSAMNAFGGPMHEDASQRVRTDGPPTAAAAETPASPMAPDGSASRDGGSVTDLGQVTRTDRDVRAGTVEEPDRRPASFSLTERLHAFRSLGGNCEFGFVQRYGGAEPSGLLRFSYTPIADLIHALDTDLQAFGAPGDLAIDRSEGGTYYCRSRRYNIWSNTAHAVGSIDPDALLEREYGRVAHLKRRMLEELGAGSKILVRKVGQGETEADLGRLAAAIARHGPSMLLRVDEAGPAWRPEPVRRLSDGVYAGSVRRFAPTETAWNVDLEPWLALCESAYSARHGLTAAPAAGSAASVTRFWTRSRRHRGRRRGRDLTMFTRGVDPAEFDPVTIYVLSAWVWIPPDAFPERIFAAMGWGQLGWRDADLDLRGCWQRVWAAGRFERDRGRARIGLGMVGGRRDRFWSCGAELSEGPVPPTIAPPTSAPNLWWPFW